MRCGFYIVFLMLNLFFANLLHADIQPADEARDMLWKRLISIQSMQASFQQTVYNHKKVLNQSSGSMAFERPGHFYWNTTKPMKQTLVADGKQFWVYDIELEQVTVRDQSKVLGAASALFLGDDLSRLKKNYQVKQMPSPENDIKRFIFDLTALSDQANLEKIRLVFHEDQLVDMILYDQLSQKTEIHFSHIRLNQAIPSQRFKFSPPSGVDVVYQ